MLLIKHSLRQRRLWKRFFKLNFETLSNIRKYLDLNFLYKVINNIYDCSNLLKLIKFRVPVESKRNKELFHVPYSRINSRKHSPMIRMMHEYNEILKLHSDVDFALPMNRFGRLVREALSINRVHAGDWQVFMW